MRFLLAVFLLLPATALAQYAPGNDPCNSAAKSTLPISQAGSAVLFTAKTGAINYICSFHVVVADAENISLVEGTGNTCGTNTAAVIGGTTAAAGANLGAGAVLPIGDGSATIASGRHSAYDVCLLQSGSGRIGGTITYVQR